MFLQDNTDGDKMKRVTITVIPIAEAIKALAEMSNYKFTVLVAGTIVCVSIYFIVKYVPINATTLL